MNLYYGLTNYHLLCSILHKMTYFPNEKSIFVASEGALGSRIDDLKILNIFDDVYYIEDKKIRDKMLNEKLNKNSSIQEIEKISKDFAFEYTKMIPFCINKNDKLHIFADHGALGLYLLIKRQNYIYLEDAKGLYTNWENLDRILSIKDSGMREVALHYKAYGKSDLITKKYIDFSSQLNNCNFENCEDFNVNKLLEQLNKEDLVKIFKLFKLNKYNIKEEKASLVLTQRFSTYKLLTR